MADPPAPPEAMGMDGSALDAVLSSSSHLTHEEVMSRRCRRVKQLAKIYRTHYWTLMEEVKSKYREYYWKYGKSPYKEENNKKRNLEEEVRKCAVGGCKATPMALTRFCHLHILSDSKQVLYKPCTFVVKSAQGRPVLCGKPILRSTVPVLCPPHFQKAEMYVARALRKAGLNVSSPSKVAPKFHVIVAEFVQQIQTKRRAAQKENVTNIKIEEDETS